MSRYSSRNASASPSCARPTAAPRSSAPPACTPAPAQPATPGGTAEPAAPVTRTILGQTGVLLRTKSKNREKADLLSRVRPLGVASFRTEPAACLIMHHGSQAHRGTHG